MRKRFIGARETSPSIVLLPDKILSNHTAFVYQLRSESAGGRISCGKQNIHFSQRRSAETELAICFCLL